MKKNENNALTNGTATVTNDAPVVTEAVAIPVATKPKQFIVGTSEKGKAFIDELCKQLQVKGKTGKLIDLPSHAAVDCLIEIATDHRFRKVETEVEGELVTETYDRFEEFAKRFEAERNSEKPETAEDLQRTLAEIQAKLKALGLKA